ncbi:hypothetical protein LVD17_14675 [Fulvivirga ulvae]|uniref:hypothetical protein n=1 Tax=Fulvivirga ulvae TaxID=2904245 RepID=UPI001F378F6D|nr:hypothetical protein [Fulvivirga ulvae]UII35051.1 hypothetical protein LVD17_14675 [Fulvivirga ulvae]
MKQLLDNLDTGFEQPSVDKEVLEKIKLNTNDKAYFDFLAKKMEAIFTWVRFICMVL